MVIITVVTSKVSARLLLNRRSANSDKRISGALAFFSIMKNKPAPPKLASSNGNMKPSCVIASA
ncbi:hypothetical protein D3C72_797050 [compost metagenome]